MEVAGLWLCDVLDSDGDVYISLADTAKGGMAQTWLDAEDRAELIEFLQRFPLPPTGQETENAS